MENGDIIHAIPILILEIDVQKFNNISIVD